MTVIVTMLVKVTVCRSVCRQSVIRLISFDSNNYYINNYCRYISARVSADDTE